MRKSLAIYKLLKLILKEIGNLSTLISTGETVVWNLPTRNFPDPYEFTRWIQPNNKKENNMDFIKTCIRKW